MKRVLTSLLAVTLLFLFSGCSDSDNDKKEFVVQFENTEYTLDAEDIEVTLISSSAVVEPMTIDFEITGTAVEGTDYDISSKSFNLAAGAKSASVKISPKRVFEEDLHLNLTLKEGAGYTLGRISNTRVNATQEKLVYSFATEKQTMLESTIVTLGVTKQGSTQDYRAESDISIPFAVLEGSTAVLGVDFKAEGDVTAFVIPKGENKATLTFNYIESDDVQETKELVLGVDEKAAGSRFVPGKIPATNIFILGNNGISLLVGKWAHVELLGLDELLDNVEGGDNPDDVPYNNDGFEFEIKIEDGVAFFTPTGATTDLSDLFRESKMDYTAPLMYDEDLVEITGEFTSKEMYYFDSEEYNLIHFELETGNRAFSKDKETLGPVPIGIQINDDNTLDLFLRGYDKPPFLNHWWNDDKFEAFFLGFGYKFKKVSE